MGSCHCSGSDEVSSIKVLQNNARKLDRHITLAEHVANLNKSEFQLPNANPIPNTSELISIEPLKEIELNHGSFMETSNYTVLEGATSGGQKPYEEKEAKISGETSKEDFLKQFQMWISCKKGTKAIPNQDNFLVFYNKASQNELIFAVLDGHGTFGHYISDYIQKELVKILVSHELWLDDPCKVFKEAFVKCHSNLVRLSSLRNSDFDCNMSGSTCTLVVKREKKIFIGHVGDSRVVVGRRTDGVLVPLQLTQDHRPEDSMERLRIESAGGQVRHVPGGPHRVYLKGKEYPGLAITRTIGDIVSQTIGVLSVPDTIEHEILENDEFLIIATDGIWEFISNEEAVRIVGSSSDAKEATSRLSALAWTKWLSAEDDLVDDITVIVETF